MSGYHDRKLYEKCYTNMKDTSYKKQIDYNLYTNYALNSNCCNGFQGQTKNLFNQDLNKLGTKSEIESLLQWRNSDSSKCIKGRTLEEKNKLLNEKKNEFEYSCNDCNILLEQINTKLNGNFNREVPYNNNLENIYGDQMIYNGINGTDQYNNNRFGVNTKLMTKDLYYKKNKQLKK